MENQMIDSLPTTDAAAEFFAAPQTARSARHISWHASWMLLIGSLLVVGWLFLL